MEQFEIERKFLVGRLPEELLNEARATKIKQGYLILEDDRELRIRQRDDLYRMTLKQGSGLTRLEQECEISAEQFEMLWPLTLGKRVEKTRYEVKDQGLLLEIDVFCAPLAPLIVLEIEFDSVESSRAFTAPDFIIREVTDDKVYKNASLATAGLPPDVVASANGQPL